MRRFLILYYFKNQLKTYWANTQSEVELYLAVNKKNKDIEIKCALEVSKFL